MSATPNKYRCVRLKVGRGGVVGDVKYVSMESKTLVDRPWTMITDLYENLVSFTEEKKSDAVVSRIRNLGENINNMNTLPLKKTVGSIRMCPDGKYEVILRAIFFIRSSRLWNTYQVDVSMRSDWISIADCVLRAVYGRRQNHRR